MLIVETDREVLSRLYDVLEHTLSMDEFEDWFVGNTWDERTALAVAITNVLVDRSVIGDEEVLLELKDIAHTIVLDVPDARQRSASSGTLITRHEVLSGR